MNEIGPGLLYWTARHPDWHPGEFGAAVGSYAAIAGADLLLIDPLLPEDEPEPVLAALERRLGERIAILVTIGYHVRSAAALRERWQRDVPVTIHGPPQVERRLPPDARAAFRLLDPGSPGPGGVRAYRVGRPVRGERPLWLPSHRALAFGDAVVVTPGGELRMWIQEPLTDGRKVFYRERFAPTLRPLLELPVERVLVTHGAPVVDGAMAALKRAVDAPPWYHHG
jgi:glyoxylase-like metal-dependent hydrolase (beta-lactamase superfamily II)